MDATPLLRRAARIVHAGGVLAYPTEAVYGLGCDPACDDAVARIVALKGRSSRSGFILIATSLEQLDGWIAPTPAERRRLASRTTKPVTWVVSAGELCSSLVSGGRPTVAVRVTSHPVAAALCEAVGMPLVSTSANLHGRPPARSALAVRRCFGAALDAVVPGATGGRSKPSEIRDARTGATLRSG